MSFRYPFGSRDDFERDLASHCVFGIVLFFTRGIFLESGIFSSFGKKMSKNTYNIDFDAMTDEFKLGLMNDLKDIIGFQQYKKQQHGIARSEQDISIDTQNYLSTAIMIGKPDRFDKVTDEQGNVVDHTSLIPWPTGNYFLMSKDNTRPQKFVIRDNFDKVDLIDMFMKLEKLNGHAEKTDE